MFSIYFLYFVINLFFLLQSIEFNNAVMLTSLIKLHFFTRPDTNTFLIYWIFNSFKAELIIVAALTAGITTHFKSIFCSLVV